MINVVDALGAGHPCLAQDQVEAVPDVKDREPVLDFAELLAGASLPVPTGEEELWICSLSCRDRHQATTPARRSEPCVRKILWGSAVVRRVSYGWAISGVNQWGGSGVDWCRGRPESWRDRSREC